MSLLLFFCVFGLLCISVHRPHVFMGSWLGCFDTFVAIMAIVAFCGAVIMVAIGGDATMNAFLTDTLIRSTPYSKGMPIFGCHLVAIYSMLA